MMIILASCGNGYCGCESEEVFYYDEDTSSRAIDEDIYDWACDCAEGYAWYHFGYHTDYTEEDWCDYIENYVWMNWHKASYQEYLEWCENWNYDPKTIEELKGN